MGKRNVRIKGTPPPPGQGKLNPTVVDPDLQIRGVGEGVGRSSTPRDKRGGGGGLKKKNCFLALRASVWSKNKRGTRAIRAPPLDPPLYHIDFGLLQ